VNTDIQQRDPSPVEIAKACASLHPNLYSGVMTERTITVVLRKDIHEYGILPHVHGLSKGRKVEAIIADGMLLIRGDNGRIFDLRPGDCDRVR